ncbi:hypothetical protein B0H14DRAFT_2590205 [Mycena olivaceomarginata]|nr:hypothetical protein B0H14DRAFT_2590205 [Mycena olivaceomarginata]
MSADLISRTQWGPEHCSTGSSTDVMNIDSSNNTRAARRARDGLLIDFALQVHFRKQLREKALNKGIHLSRTSNENSYTTSNAFWAISPSFAPEERNIESWLNLGNHVRKMPKITQNESFGYTDS